jgi:hypothetical protein
MSQNLVGVHQFVNIVSSYNETLKPASIDLKYNENIISGVRNLTLAIDKTHIDISLPIFKFNSTPNAYSVTMEYNGIFSDLTPVTYITTSNVPTTHPDYWNIWTIQLWIYMLNNTIAAAFTNLGTKTTLPTGSKTPFISYDIKTQTLSINAQSAFYDSYNVVHPIRLYTNSRLWKFLDGISIYVPNLDNFQTLNSVNQRDAYFLFYDQKINTIQYGTPTAENYYSMASDVGSELISSWFEAKGIYITSSNLRTRNEIMPNINLTQQNQTLTLPVIYHYNFNYTGTRPIYVDTITQGPFKIIDIEKVDNLKTIDLQIFWFDKYGNASPLYLYPTEAFNITLAFQEKL